MPTRPCRPLWRGRRQPRPVSVRPPDRQPVRDRRTAGSVARALMSGPYRILLAEDDETDALLIRRALDKAAYGCALDVVGDGVEAMDYLLARGRYADTAHAPPMLDLILLDVNLPKMSGLEVLAKIKTVERLKAVPTVILTSSSFAKDMKCAYAYGANSYLIKPNQLALFVRLAARMSEYWLGFNQTPARGV